MNVSAPRAERRAEPHHLGEAAGDQRRAGALAEAAAGDDAAGDGEHVLDRAAELDADQIVARIGAERLGRRAPRQSRCGERDVGGGDGDGGRQAARDLLGEAGPGERGRTRACGRHSAMISVCSRPVALLDALGAGDDRDARRGHAARAAPPRRASPAPARRAGRGRRRASAAGSAVTSIAGGKRDAGQIGARSRRPRAIAAACAGSRAHRRDVAAGPVRDQRQRRAEGAGAGDADALETRSRPRAALARADASARPPRRAASAARAGRSGSGSEAGGEPLRAGPGDHRARCRCRALAAARRRARRLRAQSVGEARADRCVGRDAAGDDERGRRARRSRRRRRRGAARCGPRPRRRRPPGTTAQRSATSCSLSGATRFRLQPQRRLQAGEGEVAARRALQRARQREAARIAAPAPRARRSARRDRAGRGASRSCRRPRRARRRSSCRAGGSGRRPRPRRAACGRRRRAAADRERRRRRSASRSAHGLRDG